MCELASKAYVYTSVMFSLIITKTYFAANHNYALLIVFFQINSRLGMVGGCLFFS